MRTGFWDCQGPNIATWQEEMCGVKQFLVPTDTEQRIFDVKFEKRRLSNVGALKL